MGTEIDTPKIGRPSLYTQELADAICNEIMETQVSLRRICQRPGMPSLSSLFKWLRENESFSHQYAQAMAIRAEAMFEDLMEISDDGTNDFVESARKDGSTVVLADKDHIMRSRLRVDTRKWVLSKMLPKKYSERLIHSSDDTGAIEIKGGLPD